MPSAEPAVLAWLEQFEVGAITDPALIDGTLPPTERFAARLPGLAAVGLAPGNPAPEVTAHLLTGTALVTDTRLVLLADSGDRREWLWSEVADLRFMSDSAGVMMMPTQERFAAGVRLEGVVETWFARGEDPPTSPGSHAILGWWKVEGAWRSTRPGGLDAWRRELGSIFSGGEPRPC